MRTFSYVPMCEYMCVRACVRACARVRACERAHAQSLYVWAGHILALCVLRRLLSAAASVHIRASRAQARKRLARVLRAADGAQAYVEMRAFVRAVSKYAGE